MFSAAAGEMQWLLATADSGHCDLEYYECVCAYAFMFAKKNDTNDVSTNNTLLKSVLRARVCRGQRTSAAQV